MHDLKELWKYAYAWASFNDSMQSSKELTDLYGTASLPIIKALTHHTIISYVRPFKQKKSLRMGVDIIPKEMLELHETMIVLRDQVVSHQDPVTPEGDSGKLNNVWMNYRGKMNWTFSTSHPIIPPQKCMEIMQLCQCLTKYCHEKLIDEVGIVESNRVLHPGKYLIDKNPKNGTFELKKK